MKRLFTARTVQVTFVAVVAALMTGAGFAFASGSSTIHACVTKGSRTLYKAPCRRHDKKISWNQVGPRGPAGQRGPSNGYSAFTNGTIPLNDSSLTTVQTLTVPAGNYVVIAKLEPYMASGVEVVRCDLLDPSNTLVDYASTNLDGGTVSFAVVSLVGAITTSGGTVAVRCIDQLTNSGEVLYPHMAAVQVGTVTGASEFSIMKSAGPRGTNVRP